MKQTTTNTLEYLGREGFTPHHFLWKYFERGNNPYQQINSDPSKHVEKSGAGFTLLELLVVIAIIGILASVISISISSARVKSRDAKRIGDMKQAMTSLEQYRIQYGNYPTGTGSVAPGGVLLSDTTSMDTVIEPFTPNYLPMYPTAPTPADGSCSSGSNAGGNNYWYETNDAGDTYTLTFCLGRGSESWTEGTRYITPDGIQ